MAALDVRAMSDGWYLVTDGTRSWRVAVAADGQGCWTFVDGLVTFTPAAEKGASGRRRARATVDAAMSAPMPATVVAVNVEAGEAVKSGQVLIVLEAMKMELPLRSPRDGVVKVVRCVKGALVQPGASLLELE